MLIKYSICVLFLILILFVSGCKDNTITPSGNANIKLIGSYNTPGNANGVSVYSSGNSTYALVADNTSGLQIINTTDPTTPSSVSNYNPGGTAIDVTNANINGSQYAFLSN